MRPAPLWLLGLWLALPAAPLARAASAPAAASAATRASAVGTADTLLADLSPGSAKVLDDKQFLADLRAADPEKAAQLARQKLFLRDMAWLVDQYPDPGSVRKALRARANPAYDELWKLAGLGPEPEKLARWAGRYYGFDAQRRFSAAAYDYVEADSSVLLYLRAHRISAADWEARTFRERDQVLVADGVAKADEIMAAPMPWTEEQRRDFGARVQDLFSRLPQERVLELGNRVNTEGLLRGGLEDIRKRKLGPGGAALLAKANDASLAPAERLAALAQAYDGSPEKAAINPEFIKALRVDKEKKAATRFTQDQRRLLEQMVPAAYLKTISQADVARLNDYYKKHKLKVVVTDVGTTAVAEYDPGSHAIKMGTRDMEAWLEAKGRAPRDLLTDRALFDRFILETSPVFVHEATHQTQFEGMKQETAFLHNQTFEIHAMFMQAMYTRELAKRNKAFAAFLEKEQASSSLASMGAALEDAFRRGPRYFRSYIASTWYPTFPSLAQTMVLQVDALEKLAKDAESDARRRDGSARSPGPRAARKAYQAFMAANAGKDLDALRAAAGKLSPADELAVAAALREGSASTLEAYRQLAQWWDKAAAQMDEYWRKEYKPARGGRR